MPLSLGVHLIVRNEADTLPNCLQSVEGADELILVDTGSTDHTKLIAAQYGATLIDFPWIDDFAAARNAGLEAATTDWILTLDADEQLLCSLGTVRRLIEEQEDTSIEAYEFFIESVLDSSGNQRITHPSIRLFRNQQTTRYQGRIHEQIGPSILAHHPDAVIAPSTMRIQHDGYLPQFLQQQEKVARNRRILELALQESPDDPFYLYHLGVTSCQEGDLPQAVDWFHRSLAIAPPQSPYRSTLIRDLTKIYIELERIEEAAQLLDAELTRYSEYADLHALYGMVFESQGRWEEAYLAYQQAAMQTTNIYVSESGIRTRSITAMGDLSRRSLQFTDAVQLYTQALSLSPKYEPAWSGLVETLQQLQVPDEEIWSHMCATAPPQQSEDYILIARILRKMGAYPLLEQQCRSHYREHPVLRFYYADALIHLGLHLTARRCLTELLELATMVEEKQQIVLRIAFCTWVVSGFPQTRTEIIEQLHIYGLSPAEPTSSDLAPSEDPPLHTIIRQLAELAVRYQQFELARCFITLKDAPPQPSPELIYAKILFLSGYIQKSAEGFLHAMEHQCLDTEGLFMLAQILLRKQHYWQAAGLLEGLIEDHPDHLDAKTAAAFCYLQLSLQSAHDTMGHNPHAKGVPEHIAKLQNSIHLLERLPWRTKVDPDHTERVRQRKAEWME
ncbi:TPR domain-containing glycosyltransferase [Paenibacillus guangzhouensis]|uniref:TPR domain-containing glycosyltransferase n=1 Tax=Paenibacillus guangzhouensis TaxID=1473112 RepID=UPI00187B18B7|nr:TPR domain-containing glycosyltransferase [Paenibacillus guangzhouensis]